MYQLLCCMESYENMKNSQDIIKQYLNSQVDLNTIKTVEVSDDVSSVKSVNQAEIEAKQEYENFKNKLKVLDGVSSISKAKNLTKSFLPLNNEKSYLKIGSARCVVISRGNMFRVCLDSENEYICYNITKS